MFNVHGLFPDFHSPPEKPLVIYTFFITLEKFILKLGIEKLNDSARPILLFAEKKAMGNDFWI